MKKLLPLFLAAAAVLTHSAFGQTATTTPVGAMTYSFPATTAITTTTFSVPLSAPPVFTGKVGSLTPNTIATTGAGWTPGAFATAAEPFFVRFTSGAQSGRAIKITGNTTDTLTLDTTDNSTQTTPLDLSGFAVVSGTSGDTFEILPADTLASLFGDNSPQNPLVFVGGTSTFNADSISIYNKATSVWDGYFYNTTAGGWRKKGDNVIPQNNVVLYPEAGITITRRASRPATSITMLGVVPTQAPLTKTTGSISTVYSSTRFPVDITLAELSLSNWTKGTSTFNADSISIYNAAQSKWDGYFQLSANNQWRQKGDNVTDKSSLVIPAGTTIGITKRAATSGALSLLKTSTMPYAP